MSPAFKFFLKNHHYQNPSGIYPSKTSCLAIKAELNHSVGHLSVTLGLVCCNLRQHSSFWNPCDLMQYSEFRTYVLACFLHKLLLLISKDSAPTYLHNRTKGREMQPGILAQNHGNHGYDSADHNEQLTVKIPVQMSLIFLLYLIIIASISALSNKMLDVRYGKDGSVLHGYHEVIL